MALKPITNGMTGAEAAATILANDQENAAGIVVNADKIQDNTNAIASNTTAIKENKIVLQDKVNITDLPLDGTGNKYGDITASGGIGGDTNTAMYANHKMASKGKLSNVSVKLAKDSTVILHAVSIVNSVCTILHTYSAIEAKTGANTYSINDTYEIPAGAYIAVLYGASGAATFNTLNGSGYRINVADNKVTNTTVLLAVSFTIGVVKVASDILTLSQANILYEPLKGGEPGIFTYDGVDFSRATSNIADFNLALYANTQSNIKYGKEVLKSITFKAFADSTVILHAVSIVNSVCTILHTYSAIEAKTGTNTYSINDTYEIPAGAYIAVDIVGKIAYYGGPASSNFGWRISRSNMSAAVSVAEIAYNFTTFSENAPVIDGVEFKKTILYGDSISSTDYPWYKSAMEKITGGTVYNGGFSGYNTANLAKNAQLKRIFDYEPNLIVALVGGNDTGAANSVGTFNGYVDGEPVVQETNISVDYNGTYFIQAVSHIIRKIKAEYYDIRNRANLTGTETEAEKEAKIDAVLKPYFLFCTTIAQKRNNDNNAFSKPDNWERKRKAVIECCEKYQVQCIDLFDLFRVDMSLEPFWVPPTNMTNNRGIYTMDGLHPNKYGYNKMARVIGVELGIL